MAKPKTIPMEQLNGKADALLDKLQKQFERLRARNAQKNQQQ